MNNQFITFEDAVKVKGQLGHIGGGVTDIYVPKYGGPFQSGEIGDAKFLHFDFANGAKGLNVGLIALTIRNNPYTWPNMISLDVSQAIRKDFDE